MCPRTSRLRTYGQSSHLLSVRQHNYSFCTLQMAGTFVWGSVHQCTTTQAMSPHTPSHKPLSLHPPLLNVRDLHPPFMPPAELSSSEAGRQIQYQHASWTGLLEDGSRRHHGRRVRDAPPEMLLLAQFLLLGPQSQVPLCLYIYIE